MAKLGPDVITEEINIDDEDVSTDPEGTVETCVSVQCQKQIKGGMLALGTFWIMFLSPGCPLESPENLRTWVLLQKVSDLNVPESSLVENHDTM